MKFDAENKIHFENVDENYEHLDILNAINNEAFPLIERISLDGLLALHNTQQFHIKAIVDGDFPVGFIIWFDLGEGFNHYF